MGSGKGIVANYGAIGGGSPQESNVFISNITTHDLTVTVTFQAGRDEADKQHYVQQLSE